MSKKVLKYFGGFYLGILVILAILYFMLDNREEEDFWILLGVLLLIVAILLFVGLCIGMLLSILFKRPAKEKLFYWIGQLVPLGALVSLILYGIYRQDAQVSDAKANEKMINKLSPAQKDTVRDARLSTEYDSVRRIQGTAPDTLKK